MNEALDMFGKNLIEKVRDKTISQFAGMCTGTIKGDTGQLVHSQWEALEPEARSVVEMMVPLMVDLGLHNFLTMIADQPELRVAWQSEDLQSEELREVSDGLEGELYGKRGWIARFSTKTHGET